MLGESGMNRHERRAAKAKATAKPASGPQALALLHAAILKDTLEGRFLEALARCRQALALEPENADTAHLMAIVHLEAKQPDHAIVWTSRAIAKGTTPAYLTTLGLAQSALGRHNDALGTFERALQLVPNDAQLWWHKGMVLIAMDALFEALPCFEQASKLDPRHADAACKCGFILHGQKRFDEALIHLDRSLALQPRDAFTLQMRAMVLKELGRLDEALSDNQLAAELETANADIHGNLVVVLQRLGRTGEALSCYERALQLCPDVARNITNKASALSELGRLDEAMAAYRHALALDPQYAEAAWNLSLLQLLLGDFEAGWKGREVRWRFPELSQGYPKLSGRQWLGEPAIAGKRMVVCSDEGLGDTIQFVRYVPMLAARGAQVILVVDPPLVPLLSGIKGISQCLPKREGTALPAFDFHCPITSLPLAFGTKLDNIPADPGYLPPPAADRVQAFERRLGAHEKPRVGLAWSGNPGHWNDRNRSMPLAALSRLFDIDASFISLQKDPRPDDAEVLRANPGIVDLTAELADFAQTAALVSCLDLLVTVDTSVAHLAAALGKPTWLMLPHVPDFRWLLNRDDSPWYPTLRLFRQDGTRDYASVLSRVHDRLSALTATFAREPREPTGSIQT
jgi:tetratricopeptide (TPR) repeat protein